MPKLNIQLPPPVSENRCDTSAELASWVVCNIKMPLEGWESSKRRNTGQRLRKHISYKYIQICSWLPWSEKHLSEKGILWFICNLILSPAAARIVAKWIHSRKVLSLEYLVGSWVGVRVCFERWDHKGKINIYNILQLSLNMSIFVVFSCLDDSIWFN